MALDHQQRKADVRPVVLPGRWVPRAASALALAGFPAVAAAYYGGATVIMVGAGVIAGIIGLVSGLVSGGLRWHPVKSFMATLALLAVVVLAWLLLAAVAPERATLALLIVGLPAAPAVTAAFCLGRFLIHLLRRKRSGTG